MSGWRTALWRDDSGCATTHVPIDLALQTALPVLRFGGQQVPTAFRGLMSQIHGQKRKADENDHTPAAIAHRTLEVTRIPGA